jgi:hypothetical protein
MEAARNLLHAMLAVRHPNKEFVVPPSPNDPRYGAFMARQAILRKGPTGRDRENAKHVGHLHLINQIRIMDDLALCDDPDTLIIPESRLALATIAKRTTNPPGWVFTPNNYREAVSCRDAAKWAQAMQKELTTHERNGTFIVIDIPSPAPGLPRIKLHGWSWAFKAKRDERFEISEYKGRLAVQGFSQRPNVDFFESYAPTLTSNSLRLLLNIALAWGKPIAHFDVSAAFQIPELPLKERIYMRFPPGMKAIPGKCLQLLKATYGLRQASYLWDKEWRSFLTGLGFTESPADPCILVLRNNGAVDCVAGVFVDDFIVVPRTPAIRTQLKKKLFAKFPMKDLGEPKKVLGIRVEFDRSTNPSTPDLLFLSQEGQTLEYVSAFGQENATPKRDPTNGVYLSADDQPTTQKVKNEMAKHPYRRVIGCLMFLAGCTRPDISFAVNQLAKYSANPGMAHWLALKELVRYLSGTADYGLLYSAKPTQDGSFPIFYSQIFADADFASDPDSRKSVSGGCILLNGGAYAYWSRKQKLQSLSSCEAELDSLTTAAKEGLWDRRWREFLGALPPGPTVIEQDNQGTMHIANGTGISQRTKHYALRKFFVRQLIADGTFEVHYCPTDDMTADIMTKPLIREKFAFHRAGMGVVQVPARFISGRMVAAVLRF